jgi:glycosyltransferase involved in cell wall biosynthesis
MRGKRLLNSQFPFLGNKELLILSDLSCIELQDLMTLLHKFPDRQPFADTVQAYITDRIEQDWKQASDRHPPWSSRKRRPAISIIFPFFNAESTIEKSLHSIVSQRFTDFELICINDQSPDISNHIVKRYRRNDSRISLLVNDRNLGCGASRNRGIRHARGEFVFHIDPDDTIPEDALYNLYKAAQQYNSQMVKGAYSKCQALYGASTEKKRITSLCGKRTTPIINTDLAHMQDLLKTTEGHWSYLYRNDLIRNTPYPTNLKMGQDSLFLVGALLSAKRVTIIPDVVYHYNTNYLSAMNTFSFEKYLDALEWRRRAWHLLDDAGMEAIGNRLLQDYWNDAFFRSMPQSLSAAQISCFFDRYRSVMTETRIKPYSGRTTGFQKKLFRLIMAGKDAKAQACLL